MRELEHRFAREVVVVGVHSGKFIAERKTARIREAAVRLGNAHPIVNDRQYRIWRAYAVHAWPTIVVIDPGGRILGTHAGEFTAEALAPFLERAIAAAERAGTLDRRPAPLLPDESAVAPGALRYPGKVAVRGDRMAIADTGHHRVLLGRLVDEGQRLRVERVVGATGAPGSVDGEAAAFRAPQGLAFADDMLYVADSENHAIRAIALGTGVVRTVAGIGHQLRTQEDLQRGALSSPWDLACVGSTLFIAMAGTHQLYALALPTGALRVHCGTGAEALHDAPLAEAALAQPMGLVAADGRLYFADAESSAVRWADVAPEGRVGTVIGTGLFDFGDRDGVGDAVRAEHPQGLARHADGRLLVADTYNDALRWVDPASRAMTTWVRGFAEPEGVAIGAHAVYVADTNAHRIATVAEGTGEVGTLAIALE